MASTAEHKHTAEEKLFVVSIKTSTLFSGRTQKEPLKNEILKLNY
jgi:hypothetical protein